MSTLAPAYPKWRVFLLIDPTTGPTNHPDGTIFYVGLRDDLHEGGDLRDALAPEGLPGDETAARERLSSLVDQGIRPVVEVITGLDAHGPATVAALCCAGLTPAPLNNRDRMGAHRSVQRLPRRLVETVHDARRVELPEAGAAIVRVPRMAITEWARLTEEELFERYLADFRGNSTFAALKAVREAPLPVLILATGRTDQLAIREGFVLGAWLASDFEPLNDEKSRWRVMLSNDVEQAQALRHRYLHQLVERRDTKAYPLGGTGL